MPYACTILDVLAQRAADDPARAAFVFLEDGEREQPALTYAALDRRARAFARTLRRQTDAGERVVLMLPAGYPFLESFFGCLHARCIAVPAAPPRGAGSTEIPLVEQIGRDCGATVLVTCADMAPLVHALAARLGAQAWIANARVMLVEEIRDEETATATAPLEPAGPQDVAYLQYTSGSTSDPRGVIVTHRSLRAEIALSQPSFGLPEHTRMVSWLPHYHDMGLVGTLLHAVDQGFTCWFMAPQAFTAKPDRWLAAIHRYRATASGGPNFAYEFALRCAHRAAEFDLSSWTCAFNGAEPVRIRTLRRFAAAFAPSGFRLESFLPCYGLAEATLQVSGGPTGRRAPLAGPAGELLDPTSADGESSEAPISCGRALAQTQIRIVDPDTLEALDDGRNGEIWVAGPQVAAGYWGRPERTAEVFGARLPDDPATPYLRTGDQGMLIAGELFVHGRYKDAIIINGVNHQPEPIEATAERASAAIRPGGVAAVGVNVDQRERIVVIAECDRKAAEDAVAMQAACRAVRAAVARRHDLSVHKVVLIGAQTLPKTTSGKLRRQHVRQLLATGHLQTMFEG